MNKKTSKKHRAAIHSLNPQSSIHTPNKHIYGIHAVEALLKSANTAQITTLYVIQGRRDKKMNNILSLAGKNNIHVEMVPRNKLDQLCPGNHQGVVAKFSASAKNTTLVKSLNALLEQLEESDKTPLIVILDGVQDPHNLGAILRSADAAGVDAIIAPQDNAVGLTATVSKVACGAAETVPFIQVTNLSRAIEKLQQNNIWIYGLDAEAEQNIYQTDFSDNRGVALIFGAEGTGLRRLTREHCDFLIKIPMHGTVSSLNVSVSAGITLFEVVHQQMKDL